MEKMELKKENPKGSKECDPKKPERLQEKQPTCTDKDKQLTVGRTKHQKEEEDTGKRPVGKENKGKER